MGRPYLVRRRVGRPDMVRSYLVLRKLDRQDLGRAYLVGPDVVGPDVVGPYLVGSYLVRRRLGLITSRDEPGGTSSTPPGSSTFR